MLPRHKSRCGVVFPTYARTERGTASVVSGVVGRNGDKGEARNTELDIKENIMKNLIFKNGYGVYEDNTPYIIADGTVEIKITLPQLAGEYFFEIRYISEQGIGCIYTRPVKSDDCTVRFEHLGSGRIVSVLRHYLRGEIVAEYPCDTLILKECEKGIVGIPEIAELKSENEKLREDIKGLYEFIYGLKDILSDWEIDIAALTKFAFDDYKNNIYLDGKDDIKAFKNKYGFHAEEEK